MANLSIQNIDLVMTGATGGKVVQPPKITPLYEFLNVTNLTENIVYLCPAGAVDNSTAIFTFGPYTTLSVPLTADIKEGFQVFWETKGDPLLIRTMRMAFTYESLGYNQSYAESFAYAAGKLGITVENTPSVTASVMGTADVNIANTPNVAISSGNVNATIQNASLNSNVTNAVITTGRMVRPANIASFTINIPAGGSQTFDVPVTENIYDQVFVRGSFTTPVTLNNLTLKLELVYDNNGAQEDGTVKLFNAILPVLIKSSNNRDITWGPFTFSPNLFFSNIRLVLSSTTAISGATFNVLPYLRYSSATMDNNNTSPGQIQAAGGSYDVVNDFGKTLTNGGYTIIVPAGNYIKKLFISLNTIASSSGYAAVNLNLENGVGNIDYISDTAPAALGLKHRYTYDFGGGVYCAGITMYYNAAGISYNVDGYAVLSSQTPNQKVSVIS